MRPPTSTTPAVKLQRTFAATRERVWAAWTDPAQVKLWAGPKEVVATEVEIDLRVGGTFRFAMKNNEGTFIVRGEYREVTPPTRLVYTWQWQDDPTFTGETLVTVDFIAHGPESTEVRLTHEHLPTTERRRDHEEGWLGSLEKLAALLQS